MTPCRKCGGTDRYVPTPPRALGRCRPCSQRHAKKRIRSGSQRLKETVRVHGLSVADFEAMISSQQGRCAICYAPMDDPQIDHCHSRGKVRGLLCRACNLGLGFFRDDITRLHSAAVYLVGDSRLLKRAISATAETPAA